ncbi:MAG: endolytic transglycosylase MltG [Christensenellales bacterium]|nr:endolytic transglycosylase MltG [Christensenellales bacterium]
MAGGRKRRGRRYADVYTTERYSTRALHEEREYGLFWYAWLWKLIRPILIFLCSVLIVIGIVSIGYDKLFDTFLAPVDSMSAELVEFEVHQGDSVSDIGANLVEAQLLKNDDIFKYLVQLEGLTSSLQYGTYKLSPGMDVGEIIEELTSGSQTNERVITIIPGWTVEDVAEYLVGIGALENDAEFLRLCNDPDRFAGASYGLRSAQESGSLENRKYALEGYLAPDTYRVFLSATPESIINSLLTQGNKVIDAVFYSDNAEYYADEEGVYQEVERFHSDLSMDETIILASMIEKEASNAIDYARVSAVFHNRLKMGWKLESDPTATYLSGDDRLLVSDKDLQDENGYNTYVNNGLPIGPICNPSSAALNAALNPDLAFIEEGYVYFCAAEPGTGLLVYAKTEEEHKQNVEKYRPLWEQADRERIN